MTPIDYTCKVCHKPGVAYYDPACPIAKIELWQSALCCTHCYNFRNKYVTLKRSIEKYCLMLVNAQQSIRDTKLLAEATSRIREKLTALTKKISALCSDYYRVQDIWDMEIVSILLDNPRGCNKAMDAMHSGFRTISKNRFAEAA
jgi:hypothetical protein